VYYPRWTRISYGGEMFLMHLLSLSIVICLGSIWRFGCHAFDSSFSIATPLAIFLMQMFLSLAGISGISAIPPGGALSCYEILRTKSAAQWALEKNTKRSTEIVGISACALIFIAIPGCLLFISLKTGVITLAFQLFISAILKGCKKKGPFDLFTNNNTRTNIHAINTGRSGPGSTGLGSTGGGPPSNAHLRVPFESETEGKCEQGGKYEGGECEKRDERDAYAEPLLAGKGQAGMPTGEENLKIGVEMELSENIGDTKATGMELSENVGERTTRVPVARAPVARASAARAIEEIGVKTIILSRAVFEVIISQHRMDQFWNLGLLLFPATIISYATAP
jgi:hypothetical protein